MLSTNVPPRLSLKFKKTLLMKYTAQSNKTYAVAHGVISKKQSSKINLKIKFNAA